METSPEIPEPTPTNLIDITMPDGSSFQIHAPGAPDVLQTRKYEAVSEVGTPLEPITSGLDVPTAPEAPDYLVELDEEIDHLDFDIDPADFEPFDPEVEPEPVVLYSGVAIGGLGDILRRRRARKAREKASALDASAVRASDEILDEVDVLDHRRKDTKTKKGMYAEKPILEGIPDEVNEDGRVVIGDDGKPKKVKITEDSDLAALGVTKVGEESITDQAYGDSIKSFQSAHMTRRIFFDERGNRITKKEHDRREAVKDEVDEIKSQIKEILDGRGLDELSDSELTSVSALSDMIEDIQNKDQTERANTEVMKTGRWQTMSQEKARTETYESLTDPRKRESATRNSKIRHELAVVGSEIQQIKNLYGIEGDGGEVPASMPQHAIDRLNELEAHRQHLAHEMAERRAGTDEDSKQQRRKIKKAAEKQQRLRDRADVETVKAAERTWRASAADLSADEIIDLADAEDAARDRIASKGRRGRRRRR